MPVTQSTYARDPNALEALKKFVLPRGSIVSRNVAEADPELALPEPTQGVMTAPDAQLAANERVKQMFGLGPSPAMQQQQKELQSRDEAINNARISANPEVTAQTDRLYKEKLGLAGEPNRIAGQNALAVEKQKQEPLNRFMDQQTAAGPNAMKFIPSVSESGVSFRGEAPDKLNAQEQALVDSAHQISALGVPLLSKYEAKYPGIGTDPKKYGSPLSDTLTEKLGKGIYSFGGMTDNDALLQESAAIQAWGVRALAGGRITQAIMDLINAHLPQPGFSPGANYDRLHRLISNILPAQLQGISEGHGSQALSLPSATDPYRNPDYQPR